MPLAEKKRVRISPLPPASLRLLTKFPIYFPGHNSRRISTYRRRWIETAARDHASGTARRALTAHDASERADPPERLSADRWEGGAMGGSNDGLVLRGGRHGPFWVREMRLAT